MLASGEFNISYSVLPHSRPTRYVKFRLLCAYKINEKYGYKWSVDTNIG